MALTKATAPSSDEGGHVDGEDDEENEAFLVKFLRQVFVPEEVKPALILRILRVLLSLLVRPSLTFTGS